MLKRYFEFCGMKSVIFQILTFGWLSLCFLVYAIPVLSVVANGFKIAHRPVSSLFFIAPGFIFFPLLLLAFGIPLAIAAVATLKR